MGKLKWEYFRQIFDSAFAEQYIASVLSDGNNNPETDQFSEDSLDYIYEDLGIDFQFVKEGKEYELENIFFHLNNSEDGYASFLNPPFQVNKDLKRADVHKMFGTPDEVDEGIPDIGLNPSDIFKNKAYNLVFEYTDNLKIKTFSIQTKFNK